VRFCRQDITPSCTPKSNALIMKPYALVVLLFFFLLFFVSLNFLLASPRWPS
jgi:hypothetical protein